MPRPMVTPPSIWLRVLRVEDAADVDDGDDAATSTRGRRGSMATSQNIAPKEKVA
jgi:hypothetical protein